MSKSLPISVKRVISRGLLAKMTQGTIDEATSFVIHQVTDEILYGGYTFEDGTHVFLFL
jgi:hypothetical protein